MAAVKVLARGWKVEIQNPDTLSWNEIKGIDTLTFSGSKNDADTTTFDDNGWNTHLVASRGRTISLGGKYLEDPTTGDRDAGQSLVDALNDAIGTESLGSFKLTSPFGTVREFTASANVADVGGGNDDPTAWSCELTCSGAASFAVVSSTSISCTPATVTLAVGATQLITTAFTPGNTTNKTLTYASSDATKAIITAEGRIVAIATGSATITITSADGDTDTIAVTVS
jgi:uncharacterized protein YjdB